MRFGWFDRLIDLDDWTDFPPRTWRSSSHNTQQQGDFGNTNGNCTSLFLNEAAMESLPWLQAALAAGGQQDGDEGDGAAGVEGKLCCPNARCRTRLGGFNWSGSQCSCGSWVVPAVQVVASRVDRKGPEETSGMLVVDFFAGVGVGAKAGGGGGRGKEGAGAAATTTVGVV